MLLICDLCDKKVSQLAKIPCGFYIEKTGDQFTFIMPNDELGYRNICARCILQECEKEQ